MFYKANGISAENPTAIISRVPYENDWEDSTKEKPQVHPV